MAGIAFELLQRLRAHGDHPLLFGVREETATARQAAVAIEEAAAGLLAAGMARGDRIALVADNDPRWILADLACLAIGAVDVPRAADAGEQDVAFVARHADCRALIVQTRELLARLGGVIERHDFRLVVVLKVDDSEGPLPPGILDLAALRELGRAAGGSALARELEATTEDDLASIVYTSGTTGNPKGVMLTHGNFLHNVRHLPGLVGFTTTDRYLSFLPTWHAFERTVEYCALAAGMAIHYSSKAAVRKDLVRVKPTVVAGVPRLWEALVSGVQAKLEALPKPKRALVRGALALSEIWGDADRRLRGRQLDADRRRARPRALHRLALALKRAVTAPGQRVADALVFRRVREATGESVRFLVSGGGALPRHVDEFFSRSGVVLLNGYGLTETAPVVSVRLPDDNVLETAGRPLPETSFRVMDEDGVGDLGPRQKGVLWIRGPQVMRGYHDNHQATAAVLRDGWFCSGDLAYLSDHDDVVICGRSKDTLVLRGGENVEPERIEAELQRSVLIEDAVLVGHGEKHLGALVLPDPEGVRARIEDLPEDRRALAQDPRVQDLIQEAVRRTLTPDHGFRSFEQVPRIALIARPFTTEDGTLTATMKKRRTAIEERYAEDLRRMFAEGSPPVQAAGADLAP